MFPELDPLHPNHPTEHQAAHQTLTNTAHRLHAPTEDLDLIRNIVFGEVLS